MDIPTLLLGIFATSFGIYTAIVRIFWPHHFGKLGPMKKLYGERAGVAVHVVGYTVLPIFFGLGLLVSAFYGGSIFPG